MEALIGTKLAQQPKDSHKDLGLDYYSMFSPVIKPAIVLLVLTIADQCSWLIHQLDINNVFLHGSLEEDIYMRQPHGFESSQHSTYICKLKKSIYGLKQAHRSWYTQLTTYLTSIGSVKSNSSSIIFHNGGVTVYILLYVDDINIRGSIQ